MYLEIDIIDKSNKIQIIDRHTKKIKTKIERQSFSDFGLEIVDNCFVISKAVLLSCYDINQKP
jgi:hypothetical protein